jgi:hypothetical protein
MRKLLFPLVCLLAILTIPVGSLWGDHTHDPRYIFDTLPNGIRAPNPKRATNGEVLHLENIKGNIRNPHRRLKAAIIDTHFAPEYTKALMDKGVIHPAALQKLNPYALTPNEHSHTSSYYSNLLRNLQHEKMFTWNSKKRALLQKKIEQTQPLLAQEKTTNAFIKIRKDLQDFYHKKGIKIHGSAVMEALHLMAPHASLLPLDLCLMSYGVYKKPHFIGAQVLTKAIRTAIDHRVDVINISLRMEDLNTASLAAIKEAINKGIVVVLAAGNGGHSSAFVSIWKTWDSVKKLWKKSKTQTLFEEVKGKGLLFAGALKYTRSGKEQVSDFTQLPEPVNGAHPHFILAPGEKLRLPITYQLDKLADGTSFSAPISAGAYLLLKQHAIEQGYSATPEDILNIMEKSGRNLTHKPSMFSAAQVLKTLDIHAARVLLDQKFRGKSRVSYVVKKPAPKTSVLKKSPVKSKAKKKSSRKATVAKKRKAPKKTKRRKISKRHRFAQRNS